MKHVLLLLFVLQVHFASANKTDSLRGNQEAVNESSINNYKNEVVNIYKQYQGLELQTLDSEYQQFLLEVKKSEPDIEMVEAFVNKLGFYHSLKQEESINLERTSTKYFKLSAKVFQYKERVQKLFVSIRGSGSFYGGMENQKQAVIQKKRLYEAGMLVFDTNMLSVKNTNPCDPATRIDYLSDNMKMLIKMEKLLMADDTKELEKSLKNLEDTEKIKELIYGYQIN